MHHVSRFLCRQQGGPSTHRSLLTAPPSPLLPAAEGVAGNGSPIGDEGQDDTNGAVVEQAPRKLGEFQFRRRRTLRAVPFLLLLFGRGQRPPTRAGRSRGDTVLVILGVENATEGICQATNEGQQRKVQQLHPEDDSLCSRQRLRQRHAGAARSATRPWSALVMVR